MEISTDKKLNFHDNISKIIFNVLHIVACASVQIPCGAWQSCKLMLLHMNASVHVSYLSKLTSTVNCNTFYKLFTT